MRRAGELLASSGRSSTRSFAGQEPHSGLREDGLPPAYLACDPVRVPIPPPSLLDRMRATFTSLDAWAEDLARPFQAPPGSALGDDDADWPPVPLSQVAVMGLGSARDHLHGVRVQIEAGELLPFGQSTLIRAALVGAAQAVWVLGPDDRSQRVARSRLLSDHMYGEHAKYLEVLERIPSGHHDGTEEVLAHVRRRRKELADVRVQAEERATLNTTAMVHEAALHAFGTQALADEAQSIWRLTSGAAHGFAWALLGQANTTATGQIDSDGMAVFTAAGGIDRIANSYMCAFHLAGHAWRLLDRRAAT